MKLTILKRIFLFVFSLISLCTAAQDVSNKGRDFWLAYPAHIDGTTSQMGIYITSDVATTGTITAAGQTISFSLAANAVVRKYIGSGATADISNATVHQSQADGIGVGGGIRIQSAAPVAVYAHIINSARSGATLALPVAVWGKEYLVPSKANVGTGSGNYGYGEIAVMAAEANTTVEITPVVSSRSGARVANTAYTITLANPGDVYQVQFQQNTDITGTLVRSVAAAGSGCKPITVFSATTWSGFDCTGSSGGDNLFQQLFPVAAFGRQFLTAPFKNRQYDIVRIIGRNPSTAVAVTRNGVTTNTTLGTGITINTFDPLSITASDPVSVIQYITSQTCSNGCSSNSSTAACQADPEMVVLSPIEQTVNNITVYSAHRNGVPGNNSAVQQCFLNIIIKTAAAGSFKINGAAPAQVFTAIPGTGYSYVQADVSTSAAAGGSQSLTADSAFSAIAYGYGNVESYGYNAGTNVRDLYQYVTIKNDSATVNFPATCVGAPFNYSVTFPYQPTSLTWDFGNNPAQSPNATVMDNSPTPASSFVRDGRTLYVYNLPTTYTFSQTGAFNLKLTANNPSPDGCSGLQELNYTVNVFAKPVAKFSVANNGCVSSAVTFTDQTDAQGRTVTKWYWSFGDATGSTVKNPTKTYSAAGIYNVKLLAVTDIGCVDDTTVMIELSQPPVAKFGISDTLCTARTIRFTDSSTTPAGTSIVRYYFDYGNGRKDTTNSAVIRTETYSAGTYTVSLVVETASGCKSAAFPLTFTVQPTPVVDFNLPTVCLPKGEAQFQGTATVGGTPVTGGSYKWYFGDGDSAAVQNPLHIYNNVGPFTVRLLATTPQGCVGEETKQLTSVYAQTKAGFSYPVELCLRATASFTDTTGGGTKLVSWRWNFGDGGTETVQNPSHLYASADTFTVRFYGFTQEGCSSDTISRRIIVNPLPKPGFRFTGPLCENTQFVLTDTSTTFGAGTISDRYWDLGNGQIFGNQPTVTALYTASGPYTVRQVITSTKGCVSDTGKVTLNINVRPKAGFTLPEVCLNDALASFGDTSKIAAGSITAYRWTYGDAVRSTNANPDTTYLQNGSHKYTQVGNYNVMQIVTANTGCKDTSTQQVTVNGAVPKSAFTVRNNGSRLCANEDVSLVNNSSVDFGSITQLEIIWDLLNNPTQKETDATPNPGKLYTHRYPVFHTQAARQFTVRVIAYSGGACSNVHDTIITVQPSPRAQLDYIKGICQESTARNLVEGRDSANLPGTFAYSGTGVTGNAFNPATSGVGSFRIRYIYTSNQGCADTTYGDIAVFQTPTAGLVASLPTCARNVIIFTPSANTTVGNITQWLYNFGGTRDSVLANGNPVPVIFPVPGPVTASLRVRTDSGCLSNAATTTFTVNALPQVSFTLPTGVCLPDGNASFTNNTTIPDGSDALLTYLWTFGDPADPTPSLLRNPTHKYSTTGAKTVKLIVRSSNNCVDSSVQVFSNIYAQPSSVATASPAFVCVNGTINFNGAGSSSPNGSINGYRWQFGDGGQSSATNPSYTFRTAGSFNVTLQVTDDKNCPGNTANVPVNVYAYPTVNAGPDLFVLEGGRATIEASASGRNLRYRWTPNLYLSNDTVLKPVTAPAADITYKLTVTAQGNCSASDEVFIKRLQKPEIPNAFSPNGDGINDLWLISYLNSYPGCTVSVYNREGAVMFESRGYSKPWDGTKDGKKLPAGVYYYIVDPKNGLGKFSGSLTILM